MTIRQLLQYFSLDTSEVTRKPGKVSEPTVFCRPGMHQVIEEPDEIVFTRGDQEFLRQLGISVHSDENLRERVIDSSGAEEARRQSPLRV